MLAGAVLRGPVTLTSESGKEHRISVIQAESTHANRDVLLAAAHRWMRDVAELVTAGEYDAANRARFASDTVFVAGQSFLQVQKPDTYVLVAQEDDGTVRGVTLFQLTDDVWALDLLTVDPPNQGGNPNPDRITGIGANLLGAAADLMAGRACTRVKLEPLDDKAQSFWRRQGFRPTGVEHYHEMSCEELQELSCRLEAEGDDHVYCKRATRLNPVSTRTY